jgi:hypothetical protein
MRKLSDFALIDEHSCFNEGLDIQYRGKSIREAIVFPELAEFKAWLMENSDLELEFVDGFACFLIEHVKYLNNMPAVEDIWFAPRAPNMDYKVSHTNPLRIDIGRETVNIWVQFQNDEYGINFNTRLLAYLLPDWARDFVDAEDNYTNQNPNGSITAKECLAIMRDLGKYEEDNSAKRSKR